MLFKLTESVEVALFHLPGTTPKSDSSLIVSFVTRIMLGGAFHSARQDGGCSWVMASRLNLIAE